MFKPVNNGMPYVILFNFLFHHGTIDRIEIDFHIFTVLVGPVNFETGVWLFELANLIALSFKAFFEVFHFHPFVFGLICAVLFSVRIAS